jgi:hypothetical protein
MSLSGDYFVEEVDLFFIACILVITQNGNQAQIRITFNSLAGKAESRYRQGL